MHTDDSFLCAIEVEPADRVRRLVYADWLDDHHDPRAELVRVEEEMRALPVFADRFWELKPRRNELRAVAGSDWCARMRYGTECEPVFRHGIPDGWRDRWRLIREFTERWHRIPMPDVGGRAKEVAEAEAQFKLVFPPSLREWVAFGASLREFPNHSIRSNFRVEPFPFDAFPIVCLYSTYSGSTWLGLGVRFTDLPLPDPPIHFAHSETDGEPTKAQDSITELAFWYALTATRDERDISHRLVAVEYDRLSDIVRAAFPVCVEWCGVTVFEGPDVVIVLEGKDDDHRRVMLKRAGTVESLPAFLQPLFPPFRTTHGAPDDIPF
jgi:uncharacterized protein (TIGR02996 family)